MYRHVHTRISVCVRGGGRGLHKQKENTMTTEEAAVGTTEEVTPTSAVRACMLELIMRGREFTNDPWTPDTHGVLTHIDQLISALELA